MINKGLLLAIRVTLVVIGEALHHKWRSDHATLMATCMTVQTWAYPPTAPEYDVRITSE